MMTHNTADVVVIGGGTIGCAIAYYLSKMDIGKVVLLERNSIGSGNTSWAASLLTKIRDKKQIIPLVEETYRSVQMLQEESNESIGLCQVGSLHIAASEETEDKLNELISIADEFKIPYLDLDHQTIEKMLPWFSAEEVRKASFMPEDAYLDAYVLATTYAKCARQGDAEIRQNAEVIDICHEGLEITGVQLRDEFISTKNVVDAAGAWANLLSLQLGVALPMAPVRSNYWITEVNAPLFPSEQPITIIPDALAYTRPESGALLFGLREKESVHFHPEDLPADLNGFIFGDPRDQWKILEEQGHLFRRFFSSFDDIGIAHYISGVSTYTPDGMFVLGSFPGVDGFYAATGCSGAGVAVSGGIGRAIAELIVGKEPYCSLAPFSIDRFGVIDPLSDSFRQRCADVRSKKKSG